MPGTGSSERFRSGTRVASLSPRSSSRRRKTAVRHSVDARRWRGSQQAWAGRVTIQECRSSSQSRNFGVGNDDSCERGRGSGDRPRPRVCRLVLAPRTRLRRCGRPGGNPFRAGLATAPPAGMGVTPRRAAAIRVRGHAQRPRGAPPGCRAQEPRRPRPGPRLVTMAAPPPGPRPLSPLPRPGVSEREQRYLHPGCTEPVCRRPRRHSQAHRRLRR